MEKTKICALFIAFIIIAFTNAACTTTTHESNSNTNANLNTANSNTNVSATNNQNTTNSTQGPMAGANTPTAAYKALFEAVKKQDIEGVKRNMSKQTINLAQMSSQTYKKTLEESLKNGMTESTMQPSMPTIRNEKFINGDQATIEVSKPSGQWEIVPFVKEDGGWKLALGEAFSGKINMTQPTNANTTPMVPINPGANNTNTGQSNIKQQKMDGRKPPIKEAP